MFLHPSPAAHALNISIFAHLQQQKWLCVYVLIPWDVLLSAIFILKEKSLGRVVICMKPAIKHTISFFPAFFNLQIETLELHRFGYASSGAPVELHSFFSNRFQDIKNLWSNRFNWLHSSSKRLKLLLSVVELRYLVCRSSKLRHGRDLKLATVAKCGTVALNTKPPFNLCIPFSRQWLSLSKPYLDSIRWTSSPSGVLWQSSKRRSSPALYILRENFLEVGMGYSNEGVSPYSGSGELDIPPSWLGWGVGGGQMELVWARLWNFPSRGCKRKRREKSDFSSAQKHLSRLQLQKVPTIPNSCFIILFNAE